MNKNKMIHIRLPENIRREIKLLCVYKDITIQEYILGLIKSDLGHTPDEKKMAKD